MLVEDIVEQDSNDNGIADWEEILWDLDPNEDGEKNKVIILQKRRDIAIANGIDPNNILDEEDLNESDKLARELLPLIVSLQQGGNLNDESMQRIADEIGKKVDEKPIADIYTKDMLKTGGISSANMKSYYEALKKVNSPYMDKDLGNELNFIAQGLKNVDLQAFHAAELVAEAYIDYGKDLMKVTVPTSVTTTHLAMANNYEKTGVAIEQIIKVFDDPLIGMSGVIQYKRYNDALVVNLDELQKIFVNNGILEE